MINEELPLTEGDMWGIGINRPAYSMSHFTVSQDLIRVSNGTIREMLYVRQLGLFSEPPSVFYLTNGGYIVLCGISMTDGRYDNDELITDGIPGTIPYRNKNGQFYKLNEAEKEALTACLNEPRPEDPEQKTRWTRLTANVRRQMPEYFQGIQD